MFYASNSNLTCRSLTSICLVAILALPLPETWCLAYEDLPSAKSVLQEAIEATEDIQFVEGKVSIRKTKNGRLAEEYRGVFKVLRSSDLPSRFEITFERKDDNEVITLRSDGKNIVVTNRQQKGNESVSQSASVFRGGTGLLQKVSLGVAAQYLQDDYFGKLKYYKPKLRAGKPRQSKVLEIEIPGKSWSYEFDPNSSQLTQLTVRTVDGADTTSIVTSYSGIKIESNSGNSTYGTVNKRFDPIDPTSIANGPFDFLIGRDVSDTTVDWSNSAQGTLADHNGKVLVIDFWASWCGPCLKELPSFVEVSKEYDSNVKFICSPWRDTKKRSRATAERFSMNDLTHDVDPDDFLLEKIGIPCTFVIDRNGKIADFICGSHGAAGKKHLRKIIDRIVNSE